MKFSDGSEVKIDSGGIEFERSFHPYRASWTGREEENKGEILKGEWLHFNPDDDDDYLEDAFRTTGSYALSPAQDDIEEALDEADIDASEIVEELDGREELMEISGVGKSKAEALYDGGYKTVEDVREASQSELSELPAIGNALAARIKADVGVKMAEKECEKVDETNFLNEGTMMVNMRE